MDAFFTTDTFRKRELCCMHGRGCFVQMTGCVSIGFIIGIIQDSVETALNSSGDVLITATAEFHYRLRRGEEIHF